MKTVYVLLGKFMSDSRTEIIQVTLHEPTAQEIADLQLAALEKNGCMYRSIELRKSTVND